MPLDPHPRSPGPTGSVTVVVWRLGDAVLAVALEDVVEVASLGPSGEDREARSRAGAAPVVVPRGLPAPSSPERVVVIRGRTGPLAVPADEVEGVRECDAGAVGPPPPWLHRLVTDQLAGLVRLGDGRVAALLRAGALASEP